MKTKSTSELSACALSVNQGLDYLQSQMHSGRWRGFPTLAGESDIWVTGFVLSHIQGLLKTQDTLKDVRRFLLASRQSTKGWSYSAIVPSDADSTAWCINALRQSDALSLSELEESTSFLWSHFVDSGISTYHKNSGIGDFISALNTEAFAGWCASHPDVSIAAVHADIHHEKVPGILNWLQRMSTDEGFINSYWWRGPFYTTTLMLRALHHRGETLPKAHAERLLISLKDLQLDNGGFAYDASTELDPFSTALALEALLYLKSIGGEIETHACAKALLESQHNDGGWTGNFILRIPAPHILNPETVLAYNNPDLGGNSFIQDLDGLFATAMACHVLDYYEHTYKLTDNTTL